MAAMSSATLWIKAFHIVFVASWFAGLLMIPAIGLGLWLWLGYGVGRGSGWMHAKLALVLGVIAYHHACRVPLRRFEQSGNHRSHTWFRIFNETSVLLFAATVVLVVVKPF